MTERGSQAVNRLLSVLLCWTENEPTLTLTEVAQRTGLSLSTAHRMVKALQRSKFLVHDQATGRYSLGPTVMSLARVVLQRADQDELVLAAMPHLERMRAGTGETVGLHVAMGTSRICLAELVSREPIRAATGVGRVFNLPAGASGRVLVAWSPERLQMVLDNGSEQATRMNKPKLVRSAEAIRKAGYAITVGETIPGAAAIAFPLFGPHGEVNACINVTGPSTRWTRQRMMDALPFLIDEVHQIDEQLGFQRA
ncbi:MAG TPA: IclR family transcriptional regulator [Natronosporangium sp.]